MRAQSNSMIRELKLNRFKEKKYLIDAIESSTRWNRSRKEAISLVEVLQRILGFFRRTKSHSRFHDKRTEERECWYYFPFPVWIWRNGSRRRGVGVNFDCQQVWGPLARFLLLWSGEAHRDRRWSVIVWTMERASFIRHPMWSPQGKWWWWWWIC